MLKILNLIGWVHSCLALGFWDTYAIIKHKGSWLVLMAPSMIFCWERAWSTVHIWVFQKTTKISTLNNSTRSDTMRPTKHGSINVGMWSSMSPSYPIQMTIQPLQNTTNSPISILNQCILKMMTDMDIKYQNLKFNFRMKHWKSVIFLWIYENLKLKLKACWLFILTHNLKHT